MGNIIRLCDWLGRVIPGPVGRRFSDYAFDKACMHSPEFLRVVAEFKTILENTPPNFWDHLPKMSWQSLIDEWAAKKIKEAANER